MLSPSDAAPRDARLEGYSPQKMITLRDAHPKGCCLKGHPSPITSLMGRFGPAATTAVCNAPCSLSAAAEQGKDVMERCVARGRGTQLGLMTGSKGKLLTLGHFRCCLHGAHADFLHFLALLTSRCSSQGQAVGPLPSASRLALDPLQRT